MYSEQTIAHIHQKLQALDSSALVLLGGSYLYGEATNKSDVDFYLICPLWRLFFLKEIKRGVKKLKKQFPEVDFSVMIVPNWLKRYGYYLYGKDTAGKIHTWAVPKQVLIRNCVKLAYFNYLRFLVSSESRIMPNTPLSVSPLMKGREAETIVSSPYIRGRTEEGVLSIVSSRDLNKAHKQLAVAYLTDAGKINFNEPIFSQKYIDKMVGAQNPPSRGVAVGGVSPLRGDQLPFDQSATHSTLLTDSARLTVTSSEVETATQKSHTPLNALWGAPLEGGFGIQQILIEACQKFLPYFSFSWSNYLLYNVRFLLRGNPLLLFKNPDKMILERLRQGLEKPEYHQILYKEMKEIIFPVIIY